MVFTLKCERCHSETVADAQNWRCPACHGPLVWSGPETFSRSQINTHEPSLWRYAAVLPVELASRITLGETITPLVEGVIADAACNFKLDYLLPSGSFKDRGATVLMSFLKTQGVTRAIEDSSGNAAAAMAAYAARAGIACTIFAPAHASAGKLVQTQAYGATVERITGSRDDVAAAAITAAGAPGATYASHNWHPFFIEGVKTWAFEIWEQLGFRAPDALVMPVGSGSMLLGAYRAFDALHKAGEIDRIPRLFAAQALACAPIYDALNANLNDTRPIERSATIAEGIVIARPVRSRELLTAIRTSKGGAVAVTEDEIGTALRRLVGQGFYAEPTSAVAAAATAKLLSEGTLQANDSIVVMLSGNGLKATETIQKLMT